MGAQLEQQRRDLESLNRELARRDALLQQGGLMLPGSLPTLGPSDLQPMLDLQFRAEQPIQDPHADALLARNILEQQESLNANGKRERPEDGEDDSDPDESVSEVEGPRESKRERRESTVAANVQHFEGLAAANASPVVDNPYKKVYDFKAALVQEVNWDRT